MRNDSSFIKWIAYLQAIGIVLVVLGHSFHEYPDGSMGKSLLLYRMLYSFRMPLFMFVSGFLMVYTTFGRDRQPSPARFAVGKLRRLMLPFLALSTAVFLPRAMMSGMADDVIELSAGSYVRSLFYADSLVIPLFWFLQSSFTLLIVSYTSLYLFHRRGISPGVAHGALITLFAVLPLAGAGLTNFWAVADTVRLGIYFTAGGAYARFFKAIDRCLPLDSAMAAVIAGALWCGLFFATESTGWSWTCSFAGIAMCISVARLLDRHGIRALDHLAGANYMIFLLSWFCNVAFQQVLAHFITLPWWIHTTLSLFSGIYVPLAAYRYLMHHPESRWIRAACFLLGQKAPKRAETAK